MSGSSDGSIYLWEWGVERPIFTARAAGGGHHSKVTKLAFAPSGHKFAAADADGLLSIWNAAPGAALGRPYFVGDL